MDQVRQRSGECIAGAARLGQWPRHCFDLYPKGQPHQNGYVERFNRTYREEVLDNYAFDSLAQARLITQAWIWMYNNERPHSSLGYMIPRGFLLKYGKCPNAQDPGFAFPTFQQDEENTCDSLFKTATK